MTTAETQPAPVLLPHVWVQPTGFGPNVYAGRIMTGHGRAAYYGRNVGQFAAMLADDLKAAAA